MSKIKYLASKSLHNNGAGINKQINTGNMQLQVVKSAMIKNKATERERERERGSYYRSGCQGETSEVVTLSPRPE